MLQDGRMAGLVKLHRSARPRGERQVRAEYVIPSADRRRTYHSFLFLEEALLRPDILGFPDIHIRNSFPYWHCKGREKNGLGCPRCQQIALFPCLQPPKDFALVLLLETKPLTVQSLKVGNLFMNSIPFYIATAAVLVCVTFPLSAQNVTTIFEHEIYVSGQDDGYHLMIDGTSALNDGQVIIWEIGVAGDAPFIMGWTGSGGSICPSVPFIVSFATDTPSVDVLPIECGRPPHKIGDGQILFENPSTPSNPGLAYLWTPEAGFTSTTPSLVDPGSGWDAIRHREISAPNEFLNFSDTRDYLRELAGDALPDVISLISGPPEATYRGTRLITSNCVSGNCPFGGTLIIADSASRKLYMAWASQDTAPGESRPPVSEWPEDLLQVLERWQSSW